MDYNETMERLVQKMVRIYARALDLPAHISMPPSRTRNTRCA